MKLSHISVIVLTRNEAINIRDCMLSAQKAGERIVIDSGSKDETAKLAVAAGATVYQHPFVNFAEQRNAAVEYARCPWVFFLDADERIPDALWDEIERLPESEAVYSIKRNNIFFGRPLNFSGCQNDYQKRLYPKRGARWVQPVHEKLETHLPTVRLDNSFLHIATRDREHYAAKLQRYIPLEAETMREQKRKVTFFDLIWRAPAKFIFLYFFKLGILDGLTGLQYSWLSAGYDFKKYVYYLKKFSG